MRKHLFILWFLMLHLCWVNAQQKPDAFFDSLLQKYTTQNFSGVILVAENGKTIYHKAVGYSEFAKKKF